jgi:hypothetical protein
VTPLPDHVANGLLDWAEHEFGPSATATVDGLIAAVEKNCGPLERAAIEFKRRTLETAAPAAFRSGLEDMLRRLGVVA